MGHACGNVCPTEELCEGACVYNHSDVKPIEIGRLQAHATDRVIRSKKKLFRTGKDTGKKIAIVGAGPAGISAACELRMLGHAVDIYEAKAKPSGLCVYGVAPYKLTNEEAVDEVNYLQEQFGFNVHYNKPITGRADFEKLEKGYDAIFIGIGLGGTSSLGVPGEDKQGVIGALEFVEELRMKQQKTPVGKKVIVLGGGNTAMDAASESCRMGAESVIIAYRRGPEEMGAYSFEFDLAKKSGAKALFHGRSQDKPRGHQEPEPVLARLRAAGQLRRSDHARLRRGLGRRGVEDARRAHPERVEPLRRVDYRGKRHDGLQQHRAHHRPAARGQPPRDLRGEEALPEARRDRSR
jgi:dihydropyrimidine dehydrogenase (NAD+) subunit PreT